MAAANKVNRDKTLMKGRVDAHVAYAYVELDISDDITF